MSQDEIENPENLESHDESIDSNTSEGQEDSGALEYGENPNPQRMALQALKDKSPADLLAFAEQLGIENAASLRLQDMMFAVLKTLAEDGVEILGSGVIEVLQDGFGFLRSPEANYLPGPDDIYVSPLQIRRRSHIEGSFRSDH